MFTIIILILFILPIQGLKVEKDSRTNKILQNTLINCDGDTEFWALLIGVGLYGDKPQNNIISMLRETDDLYEVLIQSDVWTEDHIKVIKGKDATCSNIISGLKWLDDNEDEDDISLVYISSHGSFANHDFFPYDEKDGKDEFLISYWGFACPGLYIWDDQLNYRLNQLESKGVCLIVDSCFAGGFNDKPNWIKTRDNNVNQFSSEKWKKDFGEELSGQNRVVIMASREDELSGVTFTPYLIDGLRGYADINLDGIVSAEEVFIYAKQRTKKHFQNPTIYDGCEGELPLCIISKKPNESRIYPNEADYPYKIEASENSLVCGYIIDYLTSNPIQNANVTLYWSDSQGNYSMNYTNSDNLGFYSFNVAAGKIALIIIVKGYYIKFTDYFNISENEIIWVNISLFQLIETSNICGFIKDKKTNESIQDANITLYWTDDQGNFSINYTLSDSQGFYNINVSEGSIRLYFKADGYYEVRWPYSGYYNISENETKWVNLSLVSIPPENSIIKGYVTDFSTGDPIPDADLELYWTDNEGNYRYNKTNTDSFGFYSFNVAKGVIEMFVNAEGYFYVFIGSFNIDENVIKWLNVTMNSSSMDYIICGYINNKYSNLPVENASINLNCRDLKNDYYYIETYSNDSGFYSANLRAGKIDYYIIEAIGYFLYEYYEDIEIGEKNVTWMNISLTPMPPETSNICGYIKDSETDKPIKNASIKVVWKEDYSELRRYNYTNSDSSGFYKINVAAGLIYLDVYAEYYFDYYENDFEIDENETIWKNMYLDPYPSENAVVCGYITDINTNQPMADVYIDLEWCDFNYHNSYYNSTCTDYNGFYYMNAAKGKIYIEAIANGYLDEYSQLSNIFENDILWINLSLYPIPTNTSFIYGFVKDSDTGEPLEDAWIEIEWIGCNWHHKYIDINGYEQGTNAEGYYSALVPAGEIYISVFKIGYIYNESYRIDISDSDTLCFNITLEKDKNRIEFNKPLNAFYINNDLKIPFFKPLIFGDIEIEILVRNCEDINRLYLYIDNELKLNITNELNYYFYSYLWTRDRVKIFGHKHTIKVVFYDNEGNCDIEETTVWKFF